MTVILDLSTENIVSFVDNANALLENEGHAEWHKFVDGHKFVVPATSIPSDVTSIEYENFQLDLWKKVTGRNEYVAFDCEANNNLKHVGGITETYPFVTRDRQTIKNYFAAINAIFEKIDLNPPADIIEFGTGWGHTVRFLSNSGFDVTALDIEREFLDLIPRLSLPGARDIKLIHSDFICNELEENAYDVAIFFECFHHCLNHRELISLLKKVLRAKGKIIFCAEAFYDDWFDYPWGLRLDGHSVWAIRNFGWLELGFTKTYVQDILRAEGFEVEWSTVDGIGPYGEFLVARNTM